MSDKKIDIKYFDCVGIVEHEFSIIPNEEGKIGRGRIYIVDEEKVLTCIKVVKGTDGKIRVYCDERI